jgi:serine/threonine protein kinase
MFKKISKGKDAITCGVHCGVPHYSSLESLKQMKYSKESDMFSVGTTIFQWDTHLPFIHSRVHRGQDVPFFIDVHENGRRLESWDTINQKWKYVVDEHGVIRRESLVPDRSNLSIFAPILESICNVDPSKRISAMEAMTCSDMCYILLKVAKLASKGMLFRLFSLQYICSNSVECSAEMVRLSVHSYIFVNSTQM